MDAHFTFGLLTNMWQLVEFSSVISRNGVREKKELRQNMTAVDAYTWAVMIRTMLLLRPVHTTRVHGPCSRSTFLTPVETGREHG